MTTTTTTATRRFKTQVVSGTKYYFEWTSGTIVEVWEQTWNDKLEILTMYQKEPPAPPPPRTSKV